MNSIKIAISGAHSTGKTTFINGVSKLLNNKNIDLKIVGDLAINCPLPILKQHTIESTLWIASEGIIKEIESEHKARVILVDRPILDCWAYFNVVCKGKYEGTDPKLKTLTQMIKNWLPTYDLIYQTVINEDIPIEDNKGRDLNPKYRSQIGNELIEASKLFGIKPKELRYQNREQEIQMLFEKILKSLIIRN